MTSKVINKAVKEFADIVSIILYIDDKLSDAYKKDYKNLLNHLLLKHSK